MSIEVDPALLLGEDTAHARWLGGAPAPHVYRVVRKLGTGGMADVMLATRTDEDGHSRRFAVKLVLKKFASDAEFLEMFAAEACLAARLTHPNIVAVLDYAYGPDGQPFLVMEFVSGVDLATALAYPRPLPVPAAMFIAAEILRGLAYAHALPNSQEIRGVVHRDLTPQNVLLSWEGAVKIADFGIARALTRSSVSGTTSGKPGYMSPEQTRGDRLDGRADLYSLGVVLWEMLAGRRLFGRGRIKEIFAEICSGETPPPSQFRSEVPAELDRIVAKLLAVSLEERYQRAADALTDLLACPLMPLDGTRGVVDALAVRFHQPPAGSDGVFVMAEDRRVFDGTDVTPTFRTDTEPASSTLSLDPTSPRVTASMILHPTRPAPRLVFEELTPSTVTPMLRRAPPLFVEASDATIVNPFTPPEPIAAESSAEVPAVARLSPRVAWRRRIGVVGAAGVVGGLLVALVWLAQLLVARERSPNNPHPMVPASLPAVQAPSSSKAQAPLAADPADVRDLADVHLPPPPPEAPPHVKNEPPTTRPRRATAPSKPAAQKPPAQAEASSQPGSRIVDLNLNTGGS